MLQILTAEQASLTAMRTQVQGEASSRATMLVAALSGGIVAISFIAQATRFGPESAAFALTILPVVLFLGLTTFVRIVDLNGHEVRWVAAMNRVRSGYVALEPAVEGYLVTGRDDTLAGIMGTMNPGRSTPLYGMVVLPGVVAVVDAIVAAAIAGILTVVIAPAAGLAVVFVIGALAFAAVLALQSLYGRVVFNRAIESVVRAADLSSDAPPGAGNAAH
jgi:hypothetical protein